MARMEHMAVSYSRKVTSGRTIYAFDPMTKNHQRAEISTHIARTITREISRQTRDLARDMSSELVYALAGSGE